MQGGAWTGRWGRLEAISMQGRVWLEVWAGQGLSAPERIGYVSKPGRGAGGTKHTGEVRAGR